MSEIQVLVGIPASGKSQYAKEVVRNDPENWVMVSKDNLRTLLHDGKFIKGVTEEKVIQARDALISKFLVKGINVISDDTNLKAAHVKQIKRIADDLNADFEIKYFPVELEEAIRRDKERENTVGEDVIRGMWDQFNLSKGLPSFDLEEKQQIEPYVPDTSKPDAVLFDIDGTMALMNGKRGPFEYDKVMGDTPNKPVVLTALAYQKMGVRVLFVSGREDVCREDTEDWLKANYYRHFHPDNIWSNLDLEGELFMRKAGDYRKDSQVKEEIFNEHIRDNYNVLLVIDDRLSVLQMWRKLGLYTFDVSGGDNAF